MTATKNRRSGREGQPNGKCKCRWGFQEDGQWGKVYKTCGKPVDFHMVGTRKVWHLTCLECRTQQAKHFGTTLKTATVVKPVAKPKVVKKTKPVAGLGHYIAATPKVAKPKVVKAAKVAKPKVNVGTLQEKVDEVTRLLELLNSLKKGEMTVSAAV